MKKILIIFLLLFSLQASSQDIYGYMVRVKSDSFTYKAAYRNKYLFVDTGDFRNPTRKDHHILKICIPANRRIEYPIMSAYFDSCKNMTGIKVLVTKYMIDKIRVVIQTKYK